MRIPTTFTVTFNPDPDAARGKLVMVTERFKRAVNNLDKLRKGEMDIHKLQKNSMHLLRNSICEIQELFVPNTLHPTLD